MANRSQIQSFNEDLERLLAGEAPAQVENNQENAEYQQVLATAHQLAQSDPSTHSRQRLALRQRLLAQAGQRRAHPPSRWLAEAVHWAAAGLALLALVFGLRWVLSSLIPTPQPAFQPTAQATSTPASFLLGLDTPAEELLARLNTADWQTLWISGSASELTAAGQWQTTFTQAWVARDGRGRVLSSEPLLETSQRPGDLTPRWAWVADGSRLALYDAHLGGFDPSFPAWGYANHPLENAGRLANHEASLMELIFPYFITGRGGVFSVVGLEAVANREALVLEWRPSVDEPLQDRFWVDRQTGFLLMRQTFDPATQNLLKTLRLEAVTYDFPFPAGLETSGGLNDLHFAAAAEDLPADLGGEALPTPLPPGPEPTPQPVPASSANLEIISLGLGPQPLTATLDTDLGQLYFVAKSMSTNDEQLVRASVSCLLNELGCPAQAVPGYPTPGWSALAWSPDGRMAAHIDSNNTRLYTYDPASGAWQVIAENFFATQSLLYWSPDAAWLLATLQEDAETSLVTLIRPDGSEQRRLAPELGGTQSPIGWLDADTALFLRWRDVPKGQAGQPEAPVLYQAEVSSGLVSPLSLPYSGRPVISPYPSTLALSNGTDEQLYIMDTTGDNVQALGQTGWDPAWSPSGEWLATVHVEGGLYQALVMRPDGSSPQVVFEWPASLVIAWAPDSQHLLIEAGPRPEDAGARLFLAPLNFTESGQPAGGAREIRLNGDPAYHLQYASFGPPPTLLGVDWNNLAISLPVEAGETLTPEVLMEGLFSQYLGQHLQAPLMPNLRLSDYEIYEVRPASELDPASYEVEAIFWVRFSVRPTLPLYSTWHAANGEIMPDGWVMDKALIVGYTLQDNQYWLKIIGTGP